MGLRSPDRKLSFDILSSVSSFDEEDDDGDSLPLFRSNSDPIPDPIDPVFPHKNRKKKKHKKKKKTSPRFTMIPEDPASVSNSTDGSRTAFESRTDFNCQSYVSGGGQGASGETVCTVVAGCESGYNCGELRQRNVNGSEEVVVEESSTEKAQWRKTEKTQWRNETLPNGSIVVNKLESVKSLDWKRLIAETEDLDYTHTMEQSPLKYFMEAMYSGNSLQSTTTLGDEKERQRVYDTIFRLPWRCELLIDVGFFVCLDSFLSLLTIMPTRILMALYRILNMRSDVWSIWSFVCGISSTYTGSYFSLFFGIRDEGLRELSASFFNLFNLDIIKQFNRPSAAELCDFSCFVVLACGVILLERTDISLIYHMIRGQGTIKLYVVYNVLEIFDKLCQSFGGDVLQTLFYSAEALANCPEENNKSDWIWRFIYDLALAIASSIVHSFVLLVQAITLSTCIVAHNNALLALLVSNNFSEIKSNVFKRFSKDNIHSLVYADSVERFHISAFLLFVLAQNILEAEGPWFESFLYNALLVYLCEMLIDIIKHSFLAKFNDIKPIAYSEFLEKLCKQTLNMKTETGKKNLTFVPLAPACVVIRVLTPVFAARLPCTPFPWRLFWVFLLSAITYVMLASLKVMIGIGLQKHAIWYVERCRKRKHHAD